MPEIYSHANSSDKTKTLKIIVCVTSYEVRTYVSSHEFTSDEASESSSLSMSFLKGSDVLEDT